jgi:hypothetical protein
MWGKGASEKRLQEREEIESKKGKKGPTIDEDAPRHAERCLS